MTWIFGLFRVTPCALTSCHIMISKQGRMIGAFRYNRCITGRRPRDENHPVRFRQSAENRSRAKDLQPIRSSLMSLQGGASVGTPCPLEEDMERRSPFSGYMSLHPSYTPQKYQPF